MSGMCALIGVRCKYKLVAAVRACWSAHKVNVRQQWMRYQCQREFVASYATRSVVLSISCFHSIFSASRWSWWMVLVVKLTNSNCWKLCAVDRHTNWNWFIRHAFPGIPWYILAVFSVSHDVAVNPCICGWCDSCKCYLMFPSPLVCNWVLYVGVLVLQDVTHPVTHCDMHNLGVEFQA